MKIDSYVEKTMAILDEEITPPKELASKIIQEIEKLDYVKTRRLNPMSFIQVAAAVLFGMFIGHQFGKHAEFNLKKTHVSSLDKYIQSHHLDLENNELNSFPFMNK